MNTMTVTPNSLELPFRTSPNVLYTTTVYYMHTLLLQRWKFPFQNEVHLHLDCSAYYFIIGEI